MNPKFFVFVASLVLVGNVHAEIVGGSVSAPEVPVAPPVVEAPVAATADPVVKQDTAVIPDTTETQAVPVLTPATEPVVTPITHDAQNPSDAQVSDPNATSIAPKVAVEPVVADETAPTPVAVSNLLVNRHTNQINWNIVSQQLKSAKLKKTNYTVVRACIWGVGQGSIASSSCMQKQGFCAVTNASLANPKNIPLGSIIIYQKHTFNVIAIKTGDERYNTGSDIRTPMQSTPGHVLEAIYAPGNCSKVAAQPAKPDITL